MSTLSLRVSDEELKYIQTYAAANNTSVSALTRNAVLDLIEDDLNLDKERILRALKNAESEETYTHSEVWEKLGL